MNQTNQLTQAEIETLPPPPKEWIFFSSNDFKHDLINTVNKRYERVMKCKQYRFYGMNTTRNLNLKDNLHNVFCVFEKINGKVEKQIQYHKFSFVNVKKYTKECATSKDQNFNTLDKNALLKWCQLNNIKCKKSTKYKDILHLLIKLL